MDISHSRKLGSVSTAAPVRGLVHPAPRLVLDAVLCDRSPLTALTAIPLKDIANTTIVPVHQETTKAHLRQVTLPGWDRTLPLPAELHAYPAIFLPVILSARNVWHLVNDKIEIFDRGYVLDGACRIEAACTYGQPMLIPALVLFGLDPEDELKLRSQFFRPDPSVTPTPRQDCTASRPPGSHTTATTEDSNPRSQSCGIGTATPRLLVRDIWISITIESEPFIIPTNFGYAPAILVRRPRAKQREHLLIGAKSLSLPLERIRQTRTQLTGQCILLKKVGPKKTDEYAVRPKD